MAINEYFDEFFNQDEQDLIDDLVTESVQIYGVENIYCPRTIGNYDQLYGANDVSTYNNNYPVEMYIKSYDGFTGDQRFMSKFGLENRDEITFSIPRTTYEREITSRTGSVRPQEGDLIFFPINNKIYVIKYVQHEAIFYQLGALQLYDLVCEQWEYSNEKLRTGVPQIDNIQKNYSFDMSNYFFHSEKAPPFFFATEDDFPIVMEAYQIENTTQADNKYLEGQANSIIDFTEKDPFSGGEF